MDVICSSFLFMAVSLSQALRLACIAIRLQYELTTSSLVDHQAFSRLAAAARWQCSFMALISRDAESHLYAVHHLYARSGQPGSNRAAENLINDVVRKTGEWRRESAELNVQIRSGGI